MLNSASLSSLARQCGKLREIAGNAPFLLDDPNRCIIVLQGEIDVFLVEVDGRAPKGLRQHLFTNDEDALLFGVDGRSALQPVGLLAIGQVGTIIAELDVAEIKGWAQQPQLREMLASRVDRWVIDLSQSMARHVVPRPRLEVRIAPGETVEVKPNQRLGCVRGVSWIDTGDIAPLYADSEDVAAAVRGTLLPLGAGSWISLPRPHRLPSIDTSAALASARCWPALAALHEAMLDILPLNLRLAAVDEVNRLRSRAEANDKAGRAAFNRLAEPLASDPKVAVAVEDEEPLFQACAAVAQALGHTLTPPLRRQENDLKVSPTLEAIAETNQLRTRRLALKPDWWRYDVGPFILLRAEDGQPQAVLPRGNSGYELFDPSAGTLTPLGASQASELCGEAYAFHVPLPARPLHGLDIGLGAFRWSRGDTLSLLLMAVIASLLNMGVPVATGFIVDTVIPSHNWPKLIEIGGVLVVIALVMLGLRYAVQIASLRIEGRSGTRIQAAVLDRVLRLPTAFFKDYTAGDLAKRTLAIQRIEQAVGNSLISSLLSGVFAFVSLGLMGWYSMKLMFVALGLIVLLMTITTLLGVLRIKHERQVLTTMGEAAGLLLQLSGGIAKLRLAAAEERAFLRWSRLYGRYSRKSFLAAQIDNASTVVNTLAIPLATATIFSAIYWFGLASDGLALGSLLAFLSAFSQGLNGFTGLVGAAMQIMALKPLYAYASPILESVPEVNEHKNDPGTLSGAIEISRATFRYAGDLPPVFSDLTLTIGAGDYVALVGPSGSGKSTILRLLLGFEKPESGAILFDGLDLESLSIQAVRRQFGVVLQNGKLMPGSLFENIIGPNIGLTEEDAWSAVTKVGLAEDIRDMPMGMQTVISDAGSALSGGQVQRLLLARAIVANPRILLLDEATSALDNRTQAIVTESLDRLSATRIVIAHRLSTVLKADRIIVLKDGRVHESGRYEELMDEGGFFYELAQRQLI